MCEVCEVCIHILAFFSLIVLFLCILFKNIFTLCVKF